MFSGVFQVDDDTEDVTEFSSLGVLKNHLKGV